MPKNIRRGMAWPAWTSFAARARRRASGPPAEDHVTLAEWLEQRVRNSSQEAKNHPVGSQAKIYAGGRLAAFQEVASFLGEDQHDKLAPRV